MAVLVACSGDKVLSPQAAPKRVSSGIIFGNEGLAIP